MKEFLIDHRTRCAKCAGMPKFYTTCIGISYSIPKVSGSGSWMQGISRAKYDLSRYPNRDRPVYYKGKSLRSNSIRGVASVSSWALKINKEDTNYIRIYISCECGHSTWLFRGENSDTNSRNRKLQNEYTKYPRRRFLWDFNPGK